MPIIALLCLSVAAAQSSASQPKPIPLELKQPVRDKNFYVFSLIENNAAARRELGKDPVLRHLSDSKRSTLNGLFERVDFGKITPLADIKFSQEDISTVSSRLAEMVNHGQLKGLVSALRESGVAQNLANLKDSEFLVKSWEAAASGINRCIDVYGLQTMGARSSEIDSPLYTVKNPLYGGMVKTLCGVSADCLPSGQLFFAPSLDIATRLLDTQLRDEAGRLEPMQMGVNQSAYRRARHVDYSKFTYSSILVPGYGPEEHEVHLSPIGKMEIELAAKSFRSGEAPFIIVSGGYVHPSMTPYSEAIEMKRSLIADFGVPEDAIIVDPHARHTTTNIRNAARLIFRYGIPFDKEALIITNSYQRRDIEGEPFRRRCQSVFGYQPGTDYLKKSEFKLAYKPNLLSLTIDPVDPLDP